MRLLPSYVKHIQHPIEVRAFWCDTKWQREFIFIGLDHVTANALNEGRLLACPACVDAAKAALESSRFIPEGRYPHQEVVEEVLRDLYEETKFLSSMPIGYPQYTDLVEMGKAIVPALLQVLDCDDPSTSTLSIWGCICALHEITGESVVPEEHAGMLDPIIGHWLKWGTDQGIYERIP